MPTQKTPKEFRDGPPDILGASHIVGIDTILLLGSAIEHSALFPGYIAKIENAVKDAESAILTAIEISHAKRMIHIETLQNLALSRIKILLSQILNPSTPEPLLWQTENRSGRLEDN